MALPPPDPQSTCLVTGASSGIGREITRQLAARGLNVTLVARRQERLDELVAEIERDHGVKGRAVAADLADAEARSALVGKLEDEGLNVDLLVNNAGFGTNGSFHELTRERELVEVRLNCEAVVDLSRAFLPGMITRNRGGIINLASTAAYQPVPFMATYAATKAFVLSFSEALSAELRGSAVKVTAVCPGPVPTEFSEVAGNARSFQRLPRFTLIEPDKIATITLKAFDKGRRGVIPGLLYNLIIYSSRPLPTTVKLPIVRRMFT